MVKRELKAFIIVPFVATAVWYVLMLVFLLHANGRLRLSTDVAAMAVGGVLLGLPAAALITVVVAIPGYFLVRSKVGLSLATATIAGVFIGLSASAGFWIWARETTFLSPLRGAIIGAASAAAWWQFGIRNGSS